MKLSTIYALISSAGAAVVSYLFGPVNSLILALLTLMGLDVFMGVLSSINQGKLSSGMGVKGLVKKVGVWAVIAVAHILSTQVFSIQEVLRDSTIGGFIFMEAVSIIENASAAGIPVPEILKRAIEKLKDA